MLYFDYFRCKFVISMAKNILILFKLAILILIIAGLSGCFDWSDMWDGSSGKSESTTSPTNITCCSAIFHGTLNPESQYSALAFEYGTTRSFGQTINISQSDIEDKENISTSITGLTPSTHYWLRLKWTSGTTGYGNTIEFTTLTH